MPRANWQAINEQLGSVVNAFGERQRQEQEMKQALQMMMLKAQMEKQLENQNPMTQLLNMGKVGEALKNLGLTFQDVGMAQPQGGGNQGGFPGIGTNPQQVQPQGQPGLRATKYESTPFGGVRPTAFEPQEIPTAETGKAALAQESLKNIEDVKNILFPKGTPQSYQRWTAGFSNIPGSGLPLIPYNLGGYNPQTIFRKMGAALSGRQLIQTGVAARPEESMKLVRQFAPSGLMSSKAALEGLNELEDFYKTYLSILQTKGLKAADSWAGSQDKQNNNQVSKGKIGKYSFSIETE